MTVPGELEVDGHVGSHGKIKPFVQPTKKPQNDENKATKLDLD